MRTKALLLFFTSLLGLTSSCSKELKYSKESLLFKALKADPDVKIILPKNLNDGVNCSDYAEGCKSAHIVELRSLNFIAVEFETEMEAIYAAKKVRGFYSRNWMFDDVTGEPALEKFVSTALEAKKP